ncbi:MAG: carboxymuconolactone decarboxylase family protein [Bacteroidetes bacterium]|nr:carboxymuconolactone decarboxylase family protein [Bacteroidota bacterium]
MNSELLKDRKKLMTLMKNSDPFFEEFGGLDDKAFSQGAISKKHKELTMVSISIVQKCEECIIYHLGECLNHNATREEILDAVKIGMMSSGSTSYPYGRLAFSFLHDNKIL